MSQPDDPELVLTLRPHRSCAAPTHCSRTSPLSICSVTIVWKLSRFAGCVCAHVVRCLPTLNTLHRCCLAPGFFLEHCSPPERFARSFVGLCRREPQAQANVETVGSLRWLHMFQNGLPWPWPVRNPAWPSNFCARLASAPLPRASVRLSDAGYFIRRPAWPA